MVAASVLNILPNITTDRVKSYLVSYVKGRLPADKIILGLTKIIKENVLHKYLVHILLFMYIDHPEVEAIYENDEIPFTFVPYNCNGLSPEFYCELVIHLGLHNQFLQMLSVIKNKELFQNLMQTVVTRLFLSETLKSENSETSYLGVHLDTWRLYLINIAKYTRSEEADVNVFYHEMFVNLLNKFLASHFSKEEKISITLRIAGIVCMQKTDYDDNSEICELIRDWAYDPTEKLAKKSRVTFEILYPESKKMSKEHASTSILKLVIDLLRNDKNLKIDDEDKLRWSKLYRTQHLTWLNYVGACAYLTQLILKKYADEIGEDADSLMNTISDMVLLKPKMTEEDFHGEIQSFDQFCDLLTIFGSRERYQKKWFQEFLKFPEALVSKKGVELASNFISIAADFDIAIGLVNKAVELGASNLKGNIKSIVINMLFANEKVKACRPTFINEVFNNGIHSTFAKEEFSMELNMLCTKIGTIENENDAKMQSYWEDIIYSVCFQDPLTACEGILKQSLRIHQFKALTVAKPFLAFKINEKLSNKLINLNVFQTCLYNILNITEHCDQLFDHIIQCVPLLIERDFIDFWKFHEFVLSTMDDVVLKMNAEKLYKLVLMYEQLLTYGVKENSFGEDKNRCLNFMDSLRVFSHAEAKSQTLSVMMKIRDKIYELKALLRSDEKLNMKVLTTELEKQFESFTLVELGLLYVRDPSYQNAIGKYFQDPDNFVLISFGLLLKHIVTLVFNTSNSEWNALIEFIIQVVLQSRQELNKLSPLYVLNEAIYFAYSESKKKTILLQRFLEFYNYFVQKLQASPNLMQSLEQKSTIECLASLTVAMQETSREKKDSKYFDSNVVRQILLMILSFVDWMVLRNKEFDLIKKDLLLIVYSMRIPRGVGPCVPIHRSLISRIVKQKEAPLIALSNPIEDEKLSKKLFENYVSMKANQVPEEMSKFEKEWDSRDTFEYVQPT